MLSLFFHFFFLFITLYSFAGENFSSKLKIRTRFPEYRVYYDPIQVAEEIKEELKKEEDAKKGSKGRP